MYVYISPQAAEGQYELTIDAGDIAKEYTVPGQYVQIKMSPDAKAGFFAIASPPDSRCDWWLRALASVFARRASRWRGQRPGSGGTDLRVRGCYF